MTRPRAAIGITFGALTFIVAAAVGGGALAQAPTDAASSAPATDGDCPAAGADQGVMVMGPDTSPEMMDGGGMAGMEPEASPAPSASGSGGPCDAAQGLRIDVTLSDMMRIEPAAMTVPVGVPVTFVVTNSGAVPHEFVLGDEVAQQEHEAAMQRMGGTMDGMTTDPDAMVVEPGSTRELTWTFTQAGETLAACHVPGHYAAGMKAVITVTP